MLKGTDEFDTGKKICYNYLVRIRWESRRAIELERRKHRKTFQKGNQQISEMFKIWKMTDSRIKLNSKVLKYREMNY